MNDRDYTHHIPAVDYVRADWKRGTLARITERPSLWRRILRRIFG